MVKRKGKSTRNNNTDDVVTKAPQSKRRRKHSIGSSSNDTSPQPTIEDDLPMTDTFMELDASSMDINDDNGDSDDEDSIDWETVELPKWTPLTASSQQQQQQPPAEDHGDDDQDHLAPHEQYKDVHVVFEAPRAVLK